MARAEERSFNLRSSVSDIDIVIVAINQREPVIQKICIEKSKICIDITVFHDHIKKIEELLEINPNTNFLLVMMSGFFPGLSGILNIRNINYWTSWNSAFFNVLISILKKLGVVNSIINKWSNKNFGNLIRHNENKSENTSLIVEVKGLTQNKCRG